MEVSKGKRFVALVIDIIIVVVLISLFAIIAVALNMLSLAIVGYAIGYGYYLLREQALGGQSIGHKVMGYKVVREDGSSIKGNFLASFLRNITLLIPLVDEVLVLMDKPRLGDNIAKTKVVNVK
jgi:uncharacterized RDD family membrane protein YckC